MLKKIGRPENWRLLSPLGRFAVAKTAKLLQNALNLNILRISKSDDFSIGLNLVWPTHF